MEWPIDFEDWPFIGSPKQPVPISTLMETTSRCITGGLRFKILTRDRYTCQYCGRSAPTVELRIDHVQPWSKGGKSREDNLVTACNDCNGGKRAKVLGFNWNPARTRAIPVIHITHNRAEETRLLLAVVDAHHVNFQRDIRHRFSLGADEWIAECGSEGSTDTLLEDEINEFELQAEGEY